MLLEELRHMVDSANELGEFEKKRLREVLARAYQDETGKQKT